MILEQLLGHSMCLKEMVNEQIRNIHSIPANKINSEAKKTQYQHHILGENEKEFNTCIASSLVGHITITPAPLRGVNLTLYNSSTAGIKKARVFPEPVLAAPRTSFPIKSGGIALA